jgi:dynein heavy chain 2
VAAELKTDIEEYESNWVLFEQFNNGLGELTKEDWISFRLVD